MRLGLSFLFVLGTLNGAGWSPPQDTESESYDYVFGAYNPLSKTLFATWVNQSGRPFYMTYKDQETSINPINLSDSLYYGVFVSYIESGADKGKMVATSSYDDPGAYFPVAYVYGTAWSPATVITTDSEVYEQVVTVFNSKTETLFAAWIDDNNSYPTFAYYNSGVWSGVDTFPAAASSYNVGLAYDSKNNVVFAAWEDSGTSNPYFATYPSPGTPWSNAQPITTLSDVYTDVNLVYDPSLDAIFAGWVDGSTGAPTYAIYSNGSWGAPQEIISPIVTTGYSNVNFAYNSETKQVFATWSDNNTYLPWYATYDTVTQSWSSGLIASGSLVNYQTSLAYANGFSTMFSFWMDSDNITATWSSYINPVTNLTGRKIANDFGTESEKFAQLKWSFGPTLNISGFRIYQNGVLVGEVGPETNHYAVHRLVPGSVNTFAVTAYNTYGESLPVSIVVK